MALYDVNYKPWQGRHRGIWYRRGVIAWSGLKASLQNKWMRRLVTVCWAGAFAATALLFLIGQLLVADGAVMRWIANLSGDLQVFVRGLAVWLEENPEISVRTAQNFFFYFFVTWLAPLTFIAIALAIPHLITRDLASRAILVYSSKAVNRLDYFLGKLGAMLGLMTLTWLGPVCVAWFLGNLLAPNWHFFWHSRMALANSLVFLLSGMLILSLLALSVSAASSRERNTVGLWIALWVIGGAFRSMAEHTQPWLKHASFSFDLHQIALRIFRLNEDVEIARENIPILGQMLRGVSPERLAEWENPEFTGALIGLGIMMAVGLALFLKKVKPE
jgi:ABC-2 type transport system permease protein